MVATVAVGGAAGGGSGVVTALAGGEGCALKVVNDRIALAAKGGGGSWGGKVGHAGASAGGH